MSKDHITSAFIALRQKLRKVAAHIVGPDEAEDVLHDAFCRLWSATTEVKNETEAARLSYTAVRNSAIDTLRQSGTHPTVSIENLQPGAETSSETPFGKYDEEERGMIYEKVLGLARTRLSEKQYEVFRLHDIEGLDYETTALRIGASVESIRMTLSRSRKTIRLLYLEISKRV